MTKDADVRVVSTELDSNTGEFHVTFESASREQLYDPSIERHAIKVARESGIVPAAVTKSGSIYPVDEDGNLISYLKPGKTDFKFRRVISCASPIL